MQSGIDISVRLLREANGTVTSYVRLFDDDIVLYLFAKDSASAQTIANSLRWNVTRIDSEPRE
jgi:hypothetical protein